jgi:hypothetical protein
MPLTPPSSSFAHFPRFARLAAVALVLTSTLGLAQGRYHWKLAGREAGCEVSTSEVAGKRYVAAKTSCTIDARLHDLGEVLRDIAGYPRWMHDCVTTTMLQVVDREKDTYVFWYRQHIPILADRDMVLRSEVTHEQVEGRDVYSIVATAITEVPYDSGKGYVRMPSFTSEWRLEALDPERTLVTFMIDPDLGAGLPIGLTNGRITQMPFKTIQGLNRVLEERRQRLTSTP